ncbi:MAG: hypothetical protein M1840_006571 [Geoglossum simile]|nr:MAG: hypothetical protein M1840_006571 [Geoglossum simile]
MLRSQLQHAGDTRHKITKLTDDQRENLLSTAIQRAASSEGRVKDVLKQVGDWNPAVAEQFEIKAPPFSMSPLRMLHSDWEAVPKHGQIPAPSFVALSYSWRTEEWSPVASAYHPPGSKEPVPICKCLWDFLLGLLELGEEGIWIDQLCLDQNDRLEKTSAVSSMDALYASARFVFIALEDISLTYREVSILDDATNQVAAGHLNLSIANAREIFAVVSKIFRARWFSRAWCFHEYHLSKIQVLAIPAASSPDGPIDSAIGLVNFGEFTFRLAYFQNDTIQRENEDLIHGFHAFFGGQDCAYSNIISNAFSYDSRYPQDKLTISLNICGLGLSVSGNALASTEARIYLLILALAAGDATILTTRGPKVQYGDHSEKTSWLCWPDETSWSTRYDYPLPSGIYSLSPEHISLDLLFITQAVFRSPSVRAFRKAEAFLRSELADQIRVAYGLQEIRSEYVVEHSVVETLASAIDSGLLWMIGAWCRIRGEVVAEVEQSYDSVSQIGYACLRSLFFGRLKGTFRIPTRASKRNIAFPWNKGSLPGIRTFSARDKKINDQSKARVALNSLWTRAYEMLLCILLFGKYWEMGMTVTLPGDLAITDLHSREENFHVPAPSEHKLYGKAKYTVYPKAGTVLAVPRVLVDRKFALSDRLWLMESVEDGNGSGCWRVREKVALIGCGTIKHDGRTVILAKDQRVVG